MSTAGDAAAGARMAVGTFTAVPVRVERVDRAVAGWAMLWAPVLGAALGAVCGAAAAAGTLLGLPSVLAALLGTGLAALLTRGLHLDGLADLADGLGSGRPAEGALEVMRRSDIGPFGVVTLVLVLGAQVLALGRLAEVSPWAAVAGAAVAGAAGRLAVLLACTPRTPPARPDGLGALVAGTVGPARAAAACAGTAVLCLAGLAVSPGFAAACAGAAAAGILVAVLLLRRAVRRLGGVTGDVLGALAESAATAALVVAAGASAWV
ncbi:adenosylcobinamide-GDP ribazoletransferase [Nocardiopsis algeriensis]|uniref:Adenosylcobinamide-GDP ribazoletransferase n=1 Tax=Nocardiopsis algeriensis TaxID=1478215 RepID=A0A841IKV2_9ACTN|nr:adenosylcobinamide-GDP ribazoletransferase [Nocardiopsis algeriensis]MBB6119283.1 adenosylcobinamide-GDP ribazoletransferase [Nocardiopsis algeriensis]